MLTHLLRTYLRRYLRLVVVVVALLAAQMFGNLYLPNLNADIINDGVVKGDVHYIWTTGALMLAIALVLGVLAIIAVYYASKVAMGTGADIRSAVFTRVQAFSANEMNRFGTASLITRNTNDIQQIQLFLQMALTLMVIAPIMCIGGIYMAIREDARLSLLLLVAVPVMVLVLGVVMITVVPQFRSMQVRIDRITEVLREQITGVRVIRAFVRGDSESERFDTANAGLTATTLRVNRVFALTMPLLMAILNLSSLAVVWFGGNLVSDGSMPIGNLTAFLTYIMQILISVMMAVMMVILVPRAMASAERVQQVLDATPSITDPVSAVLPARSTGRVEFRHVTFGYPGSEQPVLQDLSLEFLSGQTSAIIGGTGSGKTTLLNLVPRFVDATGGSLLVNGIDVRDQSLEQLWSSIGLVPQTAFLFSGTVASNLRFGKPEASEAELWHALEIAQARDFVAAMPGQLDAPVDRAARPPAAGRVSLENVSFRYEPDEPLIEDFSLDVAPGQSIAIVGPTGAGKTTLVNLLVRFYEIDSGHIRLDGTDYAELTRDEVRRAFGMVLQDTWLFEGTIRDNIAYGRGGATDEEIIDAATAAYVDHFVRTLPDGYATRLDADASNFSSGQKQLLTIARAFLASPPILILDEATSSVDTRTEVLIQEAMARLRQGRTSFVIAHRLSTIRNADTIIVMDAGRIVEHGNHAQLLAHRGMYYSLYNSQFTEAFNPVD